MKKLNSTASLFFIIMLIFCSCGSSEKKGIDLSKVKVEFDIPSLLGYDIDQVRMVYGMSAKEQTAEPTTEQMKLKPQTWDDYFERNDKGLLITYNPMNRKVLEYFIATGNPEGATTDYSDLLKMCNVRKDDPRYTIIPVLQTNDWLKFTGIRIVLK